MKTGQINIARFAKQNWNSENKKERFEKGRQRNGKNKKVLQVSWGHDFFIQRHYQMQEGFKREKNWLWMWRRLPALSSETLGAF